jgi:outer membrane protein OmpA-like peptidoglycan-associated protein
MNSLRKILRILVFSLLFIFISHAIFAQDTESVQGHSLRSRSLGEGNDELMQEIMANEMFRALSRKGLIRVYIKFAPGKQKILLESQPIIDQIVILLQDNPDLQLSIEGHTDNVGSSKGNKVVSEKRAKAVMKVLVDRGIDASRLNAVGWGEEKSIADNRTAEGRAKNRRIELINRVTL